MVGISDTALQLYLPKFGMRITLHLLDKNGAVRPLIDKLPERNVVQVVNDKDNNYKIHSGKSLIATAYSIFQSLSFMMV